MKGACNHKGYMLEFYCVRLPSLLSRKNSTKPGTMPLSISLHYLRHAKLVKASPLKEAAKHRRGLWACRPWWLSWVLSLSKPTPLYHYRLESANGAHSSGFKRLSISERSGTRVVLL